MIRKFTILLFLLVAVAGAQAQTSKAMADAEQAIRTADQDWMRVFAAKDLEKSVAFMAEDGSMMGPNAPIATGHEAVRKLFAVFFTLSDLKIEWQPVTVGVARSGELGYSTGNFKMTFKDPTGKTIEDHGKYVTIWKKQRDGRWKVGYDIFNTDLPAPAP